MFCTIFREKYRALNFGLCKAFIYFFFPFVRNGDTIRITCFNCPSWIIGINKRSYFLCDLSKLGETHPYKVCSACDITAAVTEALAFLDMPRVRFEVRIEQAPLGERGADEIEFLIATNAGEPLQPMIRIASGGELSRIMLALRSVLNDRDGAMTVIFDEIDTGVSGKTSRKIGIKLHETAKDTQVLCVTHSAQIASLADSHYRITKTEREGRAETEVAVLTKDERIEETADLGRY